MWSTPQLGRGCNGQTEDDTYPRSTAEGFLASILSAMSWKRRMMDPRHSYRHMGADGTRLESR